MTTNKENNIKKTVKEKTTKKTSTTIRRPSAKQVEKNVDKMSGQIQAPAVKALYLAKGDGKQVHPAIPMPVAAPGGPGGNGPEGPNPANKNTLAYIPNFPLFKLALDLGYHADPRAEYTTEKMTGLIENFSKDEVGALLVNRRKDDPDPERLWVVDGGRRLLAATENGWDTIPVFLLPEVTREQEGELYAHQDQYSVQVSPNQKHQARLVAKRRTARELQAICQQFKLTICKSSHGVARPMRAVATATKIMESTYGAATGKFVLCWMLCVMDAADWFNDRAFLKDAVSSIFLSAFADVFTEAEAEGKIKEYSENLKKRLVKLSPQMIYCYGRVEYPLMTRKGSTVTILKKLASGVLRPSDIFKVINP